MGGYYPFHSVLPSQGRDFEVVSVAESGPVFVAGKKKKKKRGQKSASVIMGDNAVHVASSCEWSLLIIDDVGDDDDGW